MTISHLLEAHVHAPTNTQTCIIFLSSLFFKILVYKKMLARAVPVACI